MDAAESGVIALFAAFALSGALKALDTWKIRGEQPIQPRFETPRVIVDFTSVCELFLETRVGAPLIW
jgi:hypothetical protein